MSKQLSSFQPQGSTKLYMPLNGNSVDISGSGNHGTDTSVSYVQGKFGQGARFIRANSSITSFATNNLNFGSNSFTISYWAKFASTSANGNTAVSVGGLVSNQEIGTGIVNNEIGANFYGGAGQIKVGTPTLNIWYYITTLVKTTGIEMYINGQYKGTGAGVAYNITGTNGNFLGNYTNYDANWGFDGVLDEVIIENRAWTPQEISLYYRKSMLNYKPRSLFNLIKDFVLTGDTAVFTITGYDATMTLIQRLVADTANFIITGYDAILKTMGWRNNDNKSSTTYTNPDNKSSSTWTNRNKNT